MTLRCFIGFFGVTRGLQYTIDSIEKNVFRPLDRLGVTQTRAGHFNLPLHIDAPRSGEYNVPFEMGDVARLGLHRQIIDPQSIDNITDVLNVVMHHGFWKEADSDGSIRRNAMHQLYSLSRLSLLFDEMQPETYDAVLILRPDIRYIDPFPIARFIERLQTGQRIARSKPRPVSNPYNREDGQVDIIVPAWQSWGGVNDRFAIATPTAARIYMTRIRNVAEFCTEKGFFHPESLLDFSLTKANLKSSKTWVRGQRIRSNGSVAAPDVVSRKGSIRFALARLLRSITVT